MSILTQWMGKLKVSVPYPFQRLFAEEGMAKSSRPLSRAADSKRRLM